ncbi:MAG: hypothetical protein HKN21_16250 [Candidatus Eisenbacteria bacterium]|uniref:Uncharacterized protein n=1 Tax=Eiseniibacteriota bacterium TaxID=2212470 RepID=A0A7Y2H3R1_UNCEI|nr:hypothetical protein [Candidatus Eisenbacteria bacterium]
MAQNRSRSLKLVLIGLVLGLSLVSCGFFDTRTPVTPPEPSDCLESRSASQFANILFNFEASVRCDLEGLTQLEETLSDDFRMTFDVVDSSEINVGSVGKDDFVEAYRLEATSLGESDSLFFQFGEVPPEDTGDQVFYDDIPYELFFLTVVSPDSAEVIEVFSGLADLTLKTNDFGDFELVTWVDFNDESPNLSFGRLIAENAQGVFRPRRSASID